jgi:adenylate cyclase
MPLEIERKFLVPDASFLAGRTGQKVVQGSLLSKHPTLRVRIVDDTFGFLTLKGPAGPSEVSAPVAVLARDEFEYPIPVEHARALLEGYARFGRLEKTRYNIDYGNHVFEVDVFAGSLAGLVMAEVELQNAAEQVDLPSWAGREVTQDHRYANSNLAVAAHAPTLSLADEVEVARRYSLPFGIEIEALGKSLSLESELARALPTHPAGTLENARLVGVIEGIEHMLMASGRAGLDLASPAIARIVEDCVASLQ